MKQLTLIFKISNMNDNLNRSTERDPELWQLAQRRVSFKYHLASYIVINTFFWILWWLTGRDRHGWPWPIYPMLGWGIGLFFHYVGAYVIPKENSVEREYEKLKRQNNK